MGVIYIGDRTAGKTHLAMELANPKNRYVKVVSHTYEEFKTKAMYNAESGQTLPTRVDKSVYNNSIRVEVTLTTGFKQLTVNWLDTPGEVWRTDWDKRNQEQWKLLMQSIRASEAVLLILAPYREMLNQPDKDFYVIEEQWVNQFRKWVEFFCQECPDLRHILICLNKADLFCPDLAQEATKLAYHPYNSVMNWQQRQTYICNKYFSPVLSDIKEINRNVKGLSARCFITSIYERSLLELPWIYLATYLNL